ncbi:MAG: protein-glutamate O-methyltransferase CheR [Magnetococcales bacterium]|nr:protein-glutamate O-methyltransferase CheR [Magnetococcales bacterium]
MQTEEIEDIEIQLLLDAIRLRYGYDFRSYNRASLNRRIRNCLTHCDFKHISEIIPRLLHEGLFLQRLISTLTVTVSSMFRDPEVFLALREKVMPVLATYPFLNIWHAGCATGEEVYSMAILLKEVGLYDRTQLFATDLDDEALAKAAEGVYPAEKLTEFASNYRVAGGKRDFADYATVKGGLLRVDPALRKNVLFANHNLAGDGVFAEMQLILCRNVLIYFDSTLQERVLTLFADSLARGGFLCLGTHETMEFSKLHDQFSPIVKKHRICRKSIQHRRPAW